MATLLLVTIFMGQDKCEIALYDDNNFIAPWLRPDDWYTRLTLSITWDSDGKVRNTELSVRNRIYFSSFTRLSVT